MKKSRIGTKITSLIFLIEALIMLSLIVTVYFFISSMLRKNAISNMQTAVSDRSKIIENYVKEMNEITIAYGQSSDVRELLLNQDDKEATKKAQEYTDRFSKGVSYLEGLYVSNWETKTLVHTNKQAQGLVMTKEKDMIDKMHNYMLSASEKTGGVTDTGAMISPATNTQIISGFMACYGEDNKTPIGFIGCGIYTKGLTDTLNELKIDGMPNNKYYMLKGDTGEYIFHENFDKIGVVDKKGYVSSVVKAIKDGKNKKGTVEYEKNGKKYIAAYNYIKDLDWIFIITDPQEEVFSTLINLSKIMIFICVLGMIILIVFSFIIISKKLNPLSFVVQSVNKLKNLEITEDDELVLYEKRTDEIGDIAGAVITLTKSLKDIVQMLKESCNSLNDKSSELYTHSNKMSEYVDDSIASTGKLSTSLVNTNNSVENIYSNIETINEKVMDIVTRLEKSTELGNKVAENSVNMKNAAESTYSRSRIKYDETKKAMQVAMEGLQKIKEINAMADSILDISSQTNLLSLNASIEAARAGEHGKGFAVVAGEISSLSDLTAQSVSSIQQISEQVNESIDIVNNCFHDILKFIELSIMNVFEELTEKTEENMLVSGEMKQEINKVHDSTSLLKNSVENISDNVLNVQGITKENEEAIDAIVDKNNNILGVTSDIREQSNENKKLAEQLEEVVTEFK